MFLFWIAAGALALFSAVEFHRFVEVRIIFRPKHLDASHTFAFEGQRFTEHLLTTPDGARLNVLHFESVDSVAKRGLILYTHGNADNLDRWGKEARHFTQLGYDVVMWDYRGFGKSRGKMTESTLLADAELLYDFAYTRAPTIGPRRMLLLYGRSIGSGVASYLASRFATVALCLETPYTNLLDMTRTWVPHYPGWGLSFRLPQDQWVQGVSAPMLILHGTADEVVPYWMGERLVKLRTDLGFATRLVTIAGGDHKHLPDTPDWQNAIRKFLAE